MPPTPRTRFRYPDDRKNSGLRLRLSFILFFVIVQVVMSIGLWLELNEIKKMLAGGGEIIAETEPKQTEPQKSSSEVAQKLETADKPEAVQQKEPTEAEIKIEEIEPAPIRVQVLNGCGVAGIAGRVGKWLERNGYDVKDIGNADRNDYPNSRILNRSGNLTAARELARLTGISENQIKRLELMPKPEVDLTLIIGKDHRRLSIGR